jgi:hypothetical protein
MYVVKKINIKRFARLLGIISALFATVPTVFGIGFLLVQIIFLSHGYFSIFSIFSLLPVLWLIVLPLLSYLFGCIYGSIFGYIYNHLAGRGYGLEIDIEMLPEIK